MFELGTMWLMIHSKLIKTIIAPYFGSKNMGILQKLHRELVIYGCYYEISIDEAEKHTICVQINTEV